MLGQPAASTRGARRSEGRAGGCELAYLGGSPGAHQSYQSVPGELSAICPVPPGLCAKLCLVSRSGAVAGNSRNKESSARRLKLQTACAVSGEAPRARP